MSLLTHSLFYYGHTIDSSNYAIDFNEGAAELQATLAIGEYTLTDFLAEVERALNAAGALTYVVSINRTTRIITIAAGSTFSLLVSTGTRSGSGAWPLLGYSGADKTGTNTYAANTASGSSYYTQFILQDYIDSIHNVRTVEAVVNKSASGKIEVVKFGTESFFEFSLKYINNFTMPSGAPIRTNLNGVANLTTLMNYLITKAPVEFIPDESNVNAYSKLLLESTPDNDKGLGFKLKELYDKGLPGYYETGMLKMRVL